MPSSLYPSRPANSRLLSAPHSIVLTNIDHMMVVLSSLVVVGAIAWVPMAYVWAWKRFKQIPKTDKKKKRLYGTLLLSLLLMGIIGPHKKETVGKWLNIKRWRLWKAWVSFVALEVVSDHKDQNFDMKKDQAILAVVPHGIFPFALGFSCLTQAAVDVFGEFRPVVATATNFIPFVRTFIQWMGGIDASRSSVDEALSRGSRIGLSPGGIAEMFEGYPKPGRLPNEECTILNKRKGFIKMALKHHLPVIPIYCFGGSKLFNRLQLPFMEKLSNFLRISICIFFGQWGLPIPFRRRLLYVIGKPIFPPTLNESIRPDSTEFREEVNVMHKRFCDELTRLFERHKNTYGWGHKRLLIV